MIRSLGNGPSFNPGRFPRSGPQRSPKASPRDGGTSHISVIDKDGMAVAMTTTINTGYGSKVIAPRSGIILNNEMDDFSTNPGKPNAFGLIQSKYNEIAPGKRPLSSMSPTLITKGGKIVLAVGASGGPTIITGTLQTLLNRSPFPSPPYSHEPYLFCPCFFY